MTDKERNDLVLRFCEGESVPDVANWAGVKRQTVEALIRDAMLQLIRKVPADGR